MFLLRKSPCHSLTNARFHREGLEHMAGVSDSHNCPGHCSASLLHCCFPKVVQIGNKRQLDMAGTTTWVCFSAPSTPSAPLRREAYRTGFFSQRCPLPWHKTTCPRSCWKVPDHPGSSLTAMHSGEPKKPLYSSMYVPVWVQVGFFPSTPQPYPIVRDGTFRMRSKLQVQTAVVTPPCTISPVSHQCYS